MSRITQKANDCHKSHDDDKTTNKICIPIVSEHGMENGIR